MYKPVTYVHCRINWYLLDVYLFFSWKTIGCISCFIVGWFTLKRFITGEKKYYFEFKYPAKNVPSILDEIERTGRTSEKPLNNVTTSYSVTHDPALSFCKSVLSCENLEMIFIVKSFSGNFG